MSNDEFYDDFYDKKDINFKEQCTGGPTDQNCINFMNDNFESFQRTKSDGTVVESTEFQKNMEFIIGTHLIGNKQIKKMNMH